MISIEDLIKSKLAIKKPKDIEVAKELEIAPLMEIKKGPSFDGPFYLN